MKTCFRDLCTVVFVVISLSGCNQKNPKISEETFLGKWYTIKGDLESYSFLKDDSSYIFVGTLGMRPVMYGTWKINKNKFIITMDNGTTTPFLFSLSNDTLTFNDGKEIYTRTIPIEEKYPEVRILTTLCEDFSSMKFSAPVPADLIWSYRVDSIQSSKSYSLKGYSISAGIKRSPDAIAEISNYLKEYGFEQDTVYGKENCTGFRDNNQIITICTSQDLKAKNDSINILITSALTVR